MQRPKPNQQSLLLPPQTLSFLLLQTMMAASDNGLFNVCLSYLDAPTLCRTMLTNRSFFHLCTRQLRDPNWIGQQSAENARKLAWWHLVHRRESSDDNDEAMFAALRSTDCDYRALRLVRFACQQRLLVRYGLLARPIISADDDEDDAPLLPLLVHGILPQDNNNLMMGQQQQLRMDDPQSERLWKRLHPLISRSNRGEYANPVLCFVEEGERDGGRAWCAQLVSLLMYWEAEERAACEESTAGLLTSLGDALWWSGDIRSGMEAYDRAFVVAMDNCSFSHPVCLRLTTNRLALVGQLLNSTGDDEEEDQKVVESSQRVLRDGVRVLDEAVTELDYSCCADEGHECMIQLNVLMQNIKTLVAAHSGTLQCVIESVPESLAYKSVSM